MARICFVQNISYEYLGVMSLSSMLKSDGHETQVFLERGQGIERLVREVMRADPTAVAFSCTTGVHRWCLRAAEEFKKSAPDLLTVFGGAHPTFFPDIVEEPQVDIVCRGEGEEALLELAERIDQKSSFSDIRNLWVKAEGRIIQNDVRPLIENLDRLPFPDRGLYVKRYPFLNRTQKLFMMGRGCPFSCAYCFNHAFKKLYENKGTFLRLRSAENIIAEIREVKARSRIKTVYFQDDTFGLDKQKTQVFLEKYSQELRLPFICLLRADLADEGIVSRLKKAGCCRVFFGIETGSEKLRNLVLKKKLTDEQIIQAAALLKRCQIRFRTYNMFGLPNESLADALKTVDLNIRIKTDYPWSSLFQPFPGTELAQSAKEQGLLQQEDDFDPSFFKRSILRLPEIREIENLHRLFFYAVKMPFLLPFIKKAIKCKLGKCYNLLFLIGYLWSYKQSERLSLLEVLRVGLSNVKNFIFQGEERP